MVIGDFVRLFQALRIVRLELTSEWKVCSHHAETVVKKHCNRKHPNNRTKFRFISFQLRLETDPDAGASEMTLRVLPNGGQTVVGKWHLNSLKSFLRGIEVTKPQPATQLIQP